MTHPRACVPCDGTGERDNWEEAYRCRDCEGTGLTPDGRRIAEKMDRARRLLRSLDRRLDKTIGAFDRYEAGEEDEALRILIGDLRTLERECDEACSALQGEAHQSQLLISEVA